MIAIACTHPRTKMHGTDSKGRQRIRCCVCGATYADKPEPAYGNLRITNKEAALVLGMLLEGMSIRSVERLSGVCRNTIGDLILRVGEHRERFMAKEIVDVPVEDVQCDELWSYVAKKERTRALGKCKVGEGDSWTFVGIERTTIVLAYHVGQRHHGEAVRFLRKLNNATGGYFQITSDGHGMYRNNVPEIFGRRVDFGQLVKNYRQLQSKIRYSPASIIASEKKAIYGRPDMDRVCTSHVERFNLTMCMQLRRFTRLTNGFSKTPEHHAAMQGLFMCWYNWCRKHETIKMTPAQAAGLADKQWSILELLERVA